MRRECADDRSYGGLRRNDDADVAPRILLSTYESLGKVAEAQGGGQPAAKKAKVTGNPARRAKLIEMAEKVLEPKLKARLESGLDLDNEEVCIFTIALQYDVNMSRRFL